MKRKKYTVSLRLFALLLALIGVLPLLTFQAAAASSSTASYDDTTLKLYRGRPSDNVAFSAGNMLPGDSVTGAYPVQLSYKGTMTLHFHADIHPDGKILAEVLKCRIAIRGGSTLYDGLMKDMPASLDYILPQGNGKTKTIPYDITVYLDTSVGNRYMGQTLLADFRWWVDAPENPGNSDDSGSSGSSGGSSGSLTTPTTGDSSHIFLWTGLCGASFGTLLLLLLRRKRKKEVASWRS